MYAPEMIAPAENHFEITTDARGIVTSPYQLAIVRVGDELQLPVGYLDEQGVNHRAAVIHHMGGDEDDMIGRPQKDLMLRIVANCTTKLGPLEVPYDDRSKEDSERMLKAVRSLTLSDLTFLLMAIRRTSFVNGHEYRFPVLCPNEGCPERRVMHMVDLSKFDIHPAPEGQQRQFSYELPMTKRKVRYAMLGGKDVDRLMAIVRANKESASSAALFARIIDVDGKPLVSYADLKKWPMGDREALRGEMRETDRWGVDLRVQTDNCPGCGAVREVEIDVTTGFFRPTATR